MQIKRKLMITLKIKGRRKMNKRIKMLQTSIKKQELEEKSKQEDEVEKIKK
jgi:hypothetical protein